VRSAASGYRSERREARQVHLAVGPGTDDVDDAGDTGSSSSPGDTIAPGG
jgi:hypothetical protein